MTRQFYAIAARSGQWWAVTINGVPGRTIHTQGRTLIDARAMAADAVATVLDCPADDVTIDIVPDLPGAPEALDEVERTRREADAAAGRAARALRDAADLLTSHGVSVRDAGMLLDVPYQRVSRLTSPTSD